MASFTPDYDAESYDYSGSASVSDEGQAPADASPFLVADTAAPVFPLNGEDLSEQVSRIQHDEACIHTSSSLFTSIPLDERHVFLCFKDPQSWPALVEAADFDRLPRSLAVTIKLRKKDMTVKTRLTVCEGRDGTDSSNGDVLLFPDMIRYKGLTHFDVDTFVDEVLVQNQVWISGRPERLSGVHIFVCSHASHDIRCGVSGPIIIGRLRHELRTRGLDIDVCVRPCTHIGGHKYRANVIVYSMEVQCYASVTADDVCQVVDELFSMGVLVGHRRGFQGRVKSEGLHSAHNSNQSLAEKDNYLQLQEVIESYADVRALNPPRASFSDKGDDHRWRQPEQFSVHSWWQPSWWLKSWEREDTLAAFAVVGAAASVYVAYQLYRIHAGH